MWTPIRRWVALQSKQMKTPYVADAHDGFFAGQSKHTLFSGLLRSFLRIAFFSTVGTCCEEEAILEKWSDGAH